MNKFLCEYCNQKLVSRQNLKNHFKKIHIDIFNNNDVSINKKMKSIQNIHVCDSCKKTFVDQRNLKKHQNKCDNKKIIEHIKKTKTTDKSKLIYEISNLNNDIDNKNVYNINNNGNMQINNDNKTINVNIIIPRNFGDENLEVLHDPEIRKSLATFCSNNVNNPNALKFLIMKLISEVHNNDKYPENKNIRIGPNENEFEIYNEGWTIESQEKIKKHAIKLSQDMLCILDDTNDNNNNNNDIIDTEYLVASIDILKKNKSDANDLMDAIHGVVEGFTDDQEYDTIDMGGRYSPKSISDTESLNDDRTDESEELLSLNDDNNNSKIQKKETKQIIRLPLKKRVKTK